MKKSWNWKLFLVGFMGALALIASTLIPMSQTEVTFMFGLFYGIFCVFLIAIIGFSPYYGIWSLEKFHPRLATIAAGVSQVGFGFLPGSIMGIVACQFLIQHF